MNDKQERQSYVRTTTARGNLEVEFVTPVNGGEIVITGGGLKPMEFPQDAELGRHSLLRLQDPQGKDLVTIDLHTGKITLAEPDFVPEAAKIFWQAIAVVWRHGLHEQSFRDLVFRAGTPGRGRAGDFAFHAGGGGNHPDSQGGDVRVQIDHKTPSDRKGEPR